MFRHCRRDLGQRRDRAGRAAGARRPPLRPGAGQRQWPRHGAGPEARLRPRRHARADSGAGRHAQRRLRRGRRDRGGAGSDRGGLIARKANREEFPISSGKRVRISPDLCGWRARGGRLHSSQPAAKFKQHKKTERMLRMGRQGMGVRRLLMASISAGLVSGVVLADGRGGRAGRETNVREPACNRGGGATAHSAARARRGRPTRSASPRSPATGFTSTRPRRAPARGLEVDKVPSAINAVDANQIKRTGSLNVTDALRGQHRRRQHQRSHRQSVHA